MKVSFRRSFVRDLEKIRDPGLLRRAQRAIEQIEAAAGIHEVGDTRKLSGTSGFYRMRIGEYRLGLAVRGEEVELVRFLHRREIYRYFP